jgi:hypothetical protein
MGTMRLRLVYVVAPVKALRASIRVSGNGNFGL